MNDNLKDKKLAFIINIAYTAVVALCLYVLLRYALPLLLPFIAAVGIAYICEPCVAFLKSRMKISRKVGAVLAVGLLLSVIAVVCALVFFAASERLDSIQAALSDCITRLKAYFTELYAEHTEGALKLPERLLLTVADYLKSADIGSLLNGKLGGTVIDSFSGMMSVLPCLIMYPVITVISSVFVSVSLPDIKCFFRRHLKPRTQAIVSEVAQSLKRIFGRYLKAYAIIMLITFCELALLFTLFDIRPSVIFAVFVALVDIFPILGVGTVLLPWAAACFVMGNGGKGAALLAIYGVVTAVRQMLEPKLIGDNIGLHPLAALVSMYVGLKLFGIWGLFALPIALTVIKDIYVGQNLNTQHEKNVDKA